MKNLTIALFALSLSCMAFAENSFDYEAMSRELYTNIDTQEGIGATATLEEIEAADALLVQPNTISQKTFDTDFQKEVIAEVKRRSGKWALQFKWIPKDSEAKNLSVWNEKAAMIPASIMKMFTGWMAYNKRVKTDNYLAHMLKHSSNSQAQSALISAGGIKAMKAYYADYLKEGIFRPTDGSGLNLGNRTTAHIQTYLLEKILASEKYNSFKKLLAMPESNGTLNGRLKNLKGKLFAKTGTIPSRGIVALSGFYETQKGKLLFTVIVNSSKSGKHTTRSHIDALVMRHVKYIEDKFSDEGIENTNGETTVDVQESEEVSYQD